MKVSLLDYGAGNVRSVRNAITSQGFEVIDITSVKQIDEAECIIFPGVGSYGTAMKTLAEKGYIEPLRSYLKADRPYLGICLGMQTLFESSDETSNNSSSLVVDSCQMIPQGLGIIPGHVTKFDSSKMSVPHIGWNGRIVHKESPVLSHIKEHECVYFVHSFYVPVATTPADWILTTTTYGDTRYVSSVQKGNIVACQFHPEKSGSTGLNIVKGFLEAVENGTLSNTKTVENFSEDSTTELVKRVVVALDVRSNDHGDLVVTKGDQYDVREADDSAPKGRGGVRNLGKPVSLASRYYEEGGDEIAFLNITSFRQGVIDDMPMLQVLEEASKNIFVPLTVGGGIRSYKCEATGEVYSALEVANRYFRAGADKISIGSDAVYAAENFYASGGKKTGETSIEQISTHYGAQAVVISIDPQRVYVIDESSTNPDHVIVDLPEDQLGPNGEKRVWYQCTVKGGREAKDICAVRVAKACEALGAGEIMLNCINMDGQGKGYDYALMNAVADAVTIPVIASSGAGKPHHFTDVFKRTNVQAALAAGMFHRKEVEIKEVKRHMLDNGIPARLS